MAIVAFMIYGIITTPLLNGFTRYVEREADRFAIEQTRRPDVFVSMIQKLGDINLAEFEPSVFIELFLYDHPPIGKRIAFAKTFQFD